MTAAAILAEAEAAGVRVEADGDWLRLTAPTPAPPALLHELAGAKAELLALLERRADEAAERAAILAEPALPPLGTPERSRLDLAQLAALAGLLATAKAPPPSQANFCACPNFHSGLEKFGEASVYKLEVGQTPTPLPP